MESKNSLPKIELAAMVFGMAAGLLGLVVIFGWLIDSRFLTQVFPEFAPMQFNTALCFFLCAIALFAYGIRRELISRIAASAMLLIVLLTAIQYLTGVSIGIDNLFFNSPEVQSNALFSGRMSPPTFVSFFLIGIVLILISFKSILRNFPIIVGLIVSLVFALALTTIFGHFMKFKTAEVGNDLLGMALHTAIGFLLISLASYFFAISDEIKHKNILPRWTSAPVAVVIMCIAVIMWQSLLTQEFHNLKSYMQLQTTSIQKIMNEKLKLHFNALERMAYRIETFRNMAPEDWKKDVSNYLRHFESYRGIIHRDVNLKVVDRIMEISFTKTFYPLTDSELKMLRAKSRKDSQFVFTRPQVNDVSELFLIVPLYNSDKFNGFIGAVLDGREFLDFGFTIENNIDYCIQMQIDLQTFDLFGKRAAISENSLLSKIQYNDSRGDWTITSWPNQNLIDQFSTGLPRVVFFGGIALSVMSFLLIYFGITAQNRSREMVELNQSLEKKVTDRTKELQDRDSFTRQWLSKCTDGAWYWDVEKNKVFMTPQFKAMLGYSENEIDDNVDTWRKLVPPMDLQVADQAYEDYLNSGKSYSYQLRWMHKDGTMVWTLCRGEGIKDENGKIVQMVGTLTNISKLKQMEEELTRWTEELERKNTEMGRFNRLAVGREKRMIELKSKINELCRELGRPEPYNLNFRHDTEAVGGNDGK